MTSIDNKARKGTWNETADDGDDLVVYLHVSKDVFSLRSEIVLHESLLTTAVPQVQG